MPAQTLFSINKPYNVIPNDTTSNSSASKSKLHHTISHSNLAKPNKKTVVNVPKKSPYLAVKSKSDLNTLKTYPDSFTIVASPKRSPSAGYQNKRRTKVIDKSSVNGKNSLKLKNDDEDDEDYMMDYEWVKPAAEKLYEASKKYLDEPCYVGKHYNERVPQQEKVPSYMLDHFGKEVPVIPTYTTDNFDQQVSMVTSPIITEKVNIGSSNR